MTLDQLREMLFQKIRKEKGRLKSFGTKIDSFCVANAIAPHVQAYGTAARHEEVQLQAKEIEEKYGDSKTGRKIVKLLKERERELCIQKDAVKNLADAKESARPYRSSKHSDDKSAHKSTSSKGKSKSKDRKKKKRK